MLIHPLASGSKGNITYIQGDSSAILVDTGLSAKQCEQRIYDAGLDMKNIAAVFITHEHGDHIQGLRVLARRYQLPVYMNEKTAAAASARGALDGIGQVNIFSNGDNIRVGDLSIHSITVSHDAADTVNYIISDGTKRLGIFTDLGHISTLVQQKAMTVDALLLEANHDVDMLKYGRYPLELKRRIRSKQGHLSNDDAIQLLRDIYHEKTLEKVWFGHLSEENNRPELLLEQMHSSLDETNCKNIEIAFQHQVANPRII